MPHSNCSNEKPSKPKDPRRHEGLCEPSKIIEDDYHVVLKEHLTEPFLIESIALLANDYVQKMTTAGYTISQPPQLVIDDYGDLSIDFSVRYKNTFYAEDKKRYDERMAQYQVDIIQWEKNDQSWNDSQVVKKSLQEIDGELGDLKKQISRLQKMRSELQNTQIKD